MAQIARRENANCRGVGVERTGFYPDPRQSGCYVGRAVMQTHTSFRPIPWQNGKLARFSIVSVYVNCVLRREASLPRGLNERGKSLRKPPTRCRDAACFLALVGLAMAIYLVVVRSSTHSQLES